MCPVCGQSFTEKKAFERHMSRNHKPRDIECLHCEQKFENKDQASRHLAMHSGLKPYGCPSCSYRSYKIYNVNIHTNKTHGRKSTLVDLVVDEEARDKMAEKIKEELAKMLSKRSVQE